LFIGLFLEDGFRPMHPTSVNGVDDMIRLGDLNEAGLLRNLLVRHKDGIIYTYTGSILVAVNPYQLLPLYTTEQVHLYTDRRLGELPPHVFAIADSCFFNMRRNKKDQCCVISGESGAGKTESTKLMLQFLAAVSGQHSWIEQQILEANPILEAFGNAKTIRNDNSSRFGKYIDINFTKGGAIEGAKIEHYLLEKSRVCRQAPEERNYHIFYCMLMGMPAEQKKILSLGNASEYNYLTMGNCTSCDGRDDIKEYAHFRSAMKILMFSENDSWEINKLLAAMLHLGNVHFEGQRFICLKDTIREERFICLNVDPKALEKSLTQRSFMTSRESVTKPLTSAQAMDGKDAFVKAIYGRLFVWVVGKINKAVFKPPPEDTKYVRQSIGLLDIFGFENFNKNSFEQLCINFANEQLQQFFVKHVFKLEQDEYARENIVWKHIEYNDNQRTLDVLANKSLNILALIDEESNFPKGTDTTMINKMNQVHGKGDVYVPPKNNHDTQFGIQHFAGVVHYDSKGFLEKNRDALSTDLIQLVEKSSNKMLKQAFQNELSSNGEIKRAPTLSGQFRQSLDALMKTLTACQPYFIRCIKPNDFKKPMLFDRDLCMRQLRYSGMMETIRIRKAGYPIRYTFDEFLERYRVLLKSSLCDPKVVRRNVAVDIVVVVIVVDFHDTMLELERMKELNEKALLIQRVLRGYKYRRQFLRQRSSALVIQKNWRGYKGRKLYRLGFARLQAKVRARQLQHHYQQKRVAAVRLQAQTRGYLARKEWQRKRRAVILLQTNTRGMLARKQVKKMKRDMFLSAKERREEELAALERQRRLNQVLQQKKEKEASTQSESITAQEMVDDIFGFLPNMVGGQEGQAPAGFKDLEKQGERTRPEEVDLDDLPMVEDIPEEDYDDLDEYSFSKFASMYFQGAATPTHVRQRLRQPLLYHEDEGDVVASMTVWWIILRFMGDLPEPKLVQGQGARGLRGSNNSLDPDLALRQDRRLSHMVGLDQVRTTGVSPNEIYCQICKQLQENGNRSSFYRGWILLSICLGIFPPTERFIKFLQSFIRFGPMGYAPYCAKRLRRTVANGVRGEPPSWLELEATKSKKPIAVSVTLMDSRTISLPVDSSSTSKEICQLLSEKVSLKDTFGFSLYVAIYEKVWSLGSGREHVMDAISQCEQEVKRKGGQEQHAPWRLYYRKEIFTPWHDCKEDSVSTDLIYRQIIRGLRFGEYKCDKDDDIVQLSAKHFYVQYGSDCSLDNAKTVVQDCINSSLLEAKTQDKWLQMVSTAHAQGPYINSRQKAAGVKAEVVDYARQKWPLFFSRFFEAAKLSGPALPKNKFIVAINWTGITFLDEKERRLLQLSYPEVTGVNTMREGKKFGQSVSLLTLKGDFSLNAVMAGNIAELVHMFLGGLRERSQYAVALQEVNQDDPTFLSFKKGELIVLIKDDELTVGRGWIKGKNERTGKTGAVPTDAVLVLPTLTKPTNEVMSLLNLSPDQRKSIMAANQKETGTVERVAPVSLKEFSYEYFRQPIKDVNRQVISKNVAPERLWVKSREPIKQPLLKKLAGNSELSHRACLYMGDYPTKQIQTPLELTDQIFGPATKDEALRDEIYCQIMKQMTSNNNRFSLEQGWQLLWLCCGLFPPSQSLLKHTQRFLESRRREPLAPDCLQRLQGSLRIEPRKLPPHQVEIDAIQQNSTQIFHKVHFPNDMEEVKSPARSFCFLKSLVCVTSFCLYVVQVLSLNDSDYFFDSLRQITDWSKKAKSVKEGGGPMNMSYLVFFMRKLWFNVSPGRDLEADLIFHYPQELPKYLRGYHRCTKEDMVNIGALLFRVKFNNDKSQFVLIPKMLKDLVPNDMLKAMSTTDWQKNIVAAYNKQASMTSEEASLAFLKVVCRWPTFGCAFFEVKQTSDPNFPDIVRIAISKQGVSIIHPKTKDVLATHPFNRIANWCSGSTYFHITVGNLVKGNKILCETSLVKTFITVLFVCLFVFIFYC
uniref:Unconventional myosin-VIIa-like n=1 Tax=Oncorhynchus kisutch TaxID=8019 RepID=A0A8C7GGW7_ONCKI